MSLRIPLIPLLFATAMFVAPASASAEQAKSTIDVGLLWTTGAGKRIRNDLVGPIAPADAARHGLWIAFVKRNGVLFPAVAHRGLVVPADTPLAEMKSLAVEVTVHDRGRRRLYRSTIFDVDRAFGSRSIDPADMHHVLVVSGDTTGLSRRQTLESDLTNPLVDAGAMWRTRRLARNYILQSDRKTHAYGKAFGVRPRFDRVRLVFVRESWVTIEPKAKPKSGGGFGALGDALSGGEKPKPRRFPTYGIDVMDNFLRTDGGNTIAFHTARSSFNDVLEGRVLYEATGTDRRVLTASGVLAQLHVNREQHGSKNRILTIDRNNTGRLEQIASLPPESKASIRGFVKRNPSWMVRLTEAPVVFREKGKPIYALHAWFQVHPRSGRRIGILPDGSRGGMTDELPRIARAGLDRARNTVARRAGGSAVKGFFAQIGGMYVASAGVLEGVSLTMANPDIAALSGKPYTTFLALHSLAHAQRFLEENASQYDTHAAQLAFWQGVLVIAAELGGEEAIRDLGRRATNGVREKAFEDAKSKAEEAIRDTLRGR